MTLELEEELSEHAVPELGEALELVQAPILGEALESDFPPAAQAPSGLRPSRSTVPRGSPAAQAQS
jgi:hypothetical protein